MEVILTKSDFCGIGLWGKEDDCGSCYTWMYMIKASPTINWKEDNEPSKLEAPGEGA